MAPVDGRVIKSLQELGFSLYEARLYLGLLTGGPQNGNELSRTSGVPSSKVYAMLERLANEGIVARIRRGSGVEYVCVPPSELLRRLREKYTRPLEHLDATLPTIGSRRPEPAVLQLESLDAVFDHARAIVRGAKEEIVLSIWEDDVQPLRSDLDAAEKRGVRIAGMFYGAGDDVPVAGWWQRHSYRETVSSRIGGRMLTMVADAEQALIAHMPEEGEASAVRTSSPVLCLVAEEYLIHDLTLQKAKTMTGYEEWDQWLRSDDDVRSLTLGRTGHLSSIEPNGKGEPEPAARRP